MLGLGACSTPPVVLDLSEKTAASTAVLQRSLAELSQNSRRITELRAANIARLHAANSAVRARNELDRELLKKTGDSSVPRHVKLLEQWSKKVEEIDSEAKVDQAAFVEQVLEARIDMQTRRAELSKVAKILAGLANEQPIKSRAKFFAGYVSEVADAVEKQREESEAAAKKAQERLNAAAK